jgi:hypothetical protein
MKYHDDDLCKQKIECILGFLGEINEIIEYPRSDREQLIRTQLELALQDLMYLNLELEADDEHF